MRLVESRVKHESHMRGFCSESNSNTLDVSGGKDHG